VRKALAQEDRKLIEISFKRLAAMHKVSMSNEEYRKLIMHEIN
jgi:hypothetical protein